MCYSIHQTVTDFFQKSFPRLRADCMPMEKTHSYDFYAGIRGSGNQCCPSSWISGFKMRSKRIDVIARIIFPVMFAMFNLIYWTSYLWTWLLFRVLIYMLCCTLCWFLYDCFAQPFNNIYHMIIYIILKLSMKIVETETWLVAEFPRHYAQIYGDSKIYTNRWIYCYSAVWCLYKYIVLCVTYQSNSYLSCFQLNRLTNMRNGKNHTNSKINVYFFIVSWALLSI